MVVNVNDVCLIITGLIQPDYINDLIHMYKNINTKIVSTWFDQDKHLLTSLKENGFIILLNKYPSESYMYQSTQIKNALLKAKELGFKYTLRTRTDLCIKPFQYDDNNIKVLNETYYMNNVMSTNIKTNDSDDTLIKFINCTTHLYDKITFLSGELCHGVKLHPTDLICFGPIDELLIMFDDTPTNNPTYVERMILDKYFKKKVSSIQEYKSKINSCIIECVVNNIDFIWNRNIKQVKSFFLINDHLINNQIRHHRFVIY
uniref:Uncharacterized protein n=1 Tax=viral metagenome TaxID=1070528 RepID=A0A6C0JPN3_9ZZZZ